MSARPFILLREADRREIAAGDEIADAGRRRGERIARALDAAAVAQDPILAQPGVDPVPGRAQGHKRNGARLRQAQAMARMGSWLVDIRQGLLHASSGMRAVTGIAADTIPAETEKP